VAAVRVKPALEFSGPYPTDKLIGCETALVLFAAAFGGMNDAAWIAEAGLRATCVDLDGEKLDEMRPRYPDTWEFVRYNAYDYGEYARRLTKWSGAYWDVVSCDPFTNEFTNCANNIEAWCRLAKHVVILGTGTDTLVNVPAGWEITQTIKRSDYAGGVYWTTLERV
jgi:hypothetical protein